MLEQLRRKSQSVIIWVLFGIIIAVFIVSFGPQAGQTTPGCGGQPAESYVVKVDGHEVGEASWRVGMNAIGAGSSGARARMMRARETVMDSLIERELLAQAAEDAGFRISDEHVNERIAAGEFYVLGQRGPGEFYYFDAGAFSFEALERYAQTLGLRSVRQFITEQRREHLAATMRGVLMGSVRVSADEVLDRYVQDNTKVTIEFVRFDWARYAGDGNLTPERLAAYLAAHEDEVKKKYEADERTYKGVPLQVRARHVFFKKAAPAVPGPGDAPAAPAEPAADPARARAVAALERIRGGADFAAVARELSEDDRSKDKGGDLGWRSVKALGWGPELSQAAEKLEPGQLADVLETARGFHVLKIEARREGDLTYEQVRDELAERLARDHFARERAREDAEAALAKVKGGAALTDLFERDEPAGGGADDGTEQGALAPEGVNVPAELGTWREGDGALLAQAQPRRIAPRPAGAPAVPAPAAPADSKPKLVKAGPILRSGAVVAGPGLNPYVGKSPELARALFDELAAGEVAEQVFQVEDGFVLAQLVERVEPDLKAFEDQRQQLRDQLAAERSYRVLDAWTGDRCRAAVAAGQIVVNPEFVRYDDAEPGTGKPAPVTYQPCQRALEP